MMEATDTRRQLTRTVVVVWIALPLLAVAAVLAFAWPSARTAPRDVPVGIVGTSPAAQSVVAGLDRAQPGGFDVHVYPDQSAARAAIDNRDIYGAFAVTPTSVTVLDSSAASTAVAQVLDTAGQQIAYRAKLTSTTVDVVPLSHNDPRGSVLASVVLPLALGSIIVAAAIAMLVRVRPVWKQAVTLAVASAVVGTGVYLIAQVFLGALPGGHFETWGAIVLTVLAISGTVAGIYSIVGTAGIGIGSAAIVFVGNAFSGATSAPDMLPGIVRAIGLFLPPGAGANLVRSTAYFHGNGGGEHLAVLIGWIVFGAVALFLGHHPSGRFTLRREPDDAKHSEPDLEIPRHLLEAPELVSANGYSPNGHSADGVYAGSHEAR